MTGQDFQDRINALVVDLQTKGKGQTVEIVLRGENNGINVFELSSTPTGVVNGAQLAALQTFVNNLRGIADDMDSAAVPVKNASEAFRLAQVPHETLATTATNARKALSDACDADPVYQSAKAAAETARANAGYIDAVASYNLWNTSENFAALSNAKGEYIV